MSAKLFKDENSDQEEKAEEVKINSEYAKNYDNWRKKEELHKCEYFNNTYGFLNSM